MIKVTQRHAAIARGIPTSRKTTTIVEADAITFIDGYVVCRKGTFEVAAFFQPEQVEVIDEALEELERIRAERLEQASAAFEPELD